MENVATKGPLTLYQRIALGHIRNGNLGIALDLIKRHRRASAAYPEFLLKKLVRAAVTKGNPLVLREANALATCSADIPSRLYLRCANNALRQGNPSYAQIAFNLAGVPCPLRRFKNLADRLLDWYGLAEFNLSDCIVAYQAAGKKPNEIQASNVLYAIKRTFDTEHYEWFCGFMGMEFDKKFLEQCLSYWAFEGDFAKTMHAALLLKKKLSKQWLIETADNAVRVGKYDEATKFYKGAYNVL